MDTSDPVPALVVRFDLVGGRDGDAAGTPPWGDADRVASGLAERWAHFGPQAIEGGSTTIRWEHLDRRFVTTAGVADGWVTTVTLDVTPLGAPGEEYDPLTGLPDREHLLARLGELLRRLEHDSAPVGVVVVDLDRFVESNAFDGDAEELVVGVARRVDRAIRAGDVVGRLGQDSFALLFGSPVGETEATVVAERLLHEIRAEGLTASGGIAFAGSAIAASELIDQARSAIELARLAGGDCVAVFDERLRSSPEWARRRTVDLKLAIELDQFVLRYQPVVDLATDRVVGAEALAQWNHPIEGLLPPAEFIPLAERTGLVRGLTDRVVATTVRQLAEWEGQMPDRFRVAVNVSASDLLRDGFADDVMSRCHDAGADPSHLRLELTETAVMADPDVAIAAIERLRGFGVTVALDDFGTGFASLSILRRLPVDTLKIDRSFVIGLPDDEQGSAVIRLITGLADELGLSVVAEGIETPGQRAAVIDAGCRLGQGELFAAPLTAGELADRMKMSRGRAMRG